MEQDIKKKKKFHSFFEKFYVQYHKMVSLSFKNEFKDDERVSNADIKTFQHKIDDLGLDYKTMNIDRFYLAYQRGFLLGDFYEFLLQQIEKTPSINDVINDKNLCSQLEKFAKLPKYTQS